MMDVTGVPEQCYRYCEAAELLSEFREKTNNSSTNIRDANIIDIKSSNVHIKIWCEKYGNEHSSK